MRIIHPRPNPIVAAMYTLRDMDVDVIVVHGPSGCCFMASRMLEEAGVRVVSSGMGENDLIFGGSEPLRETLNAAYGMFHPKTMAVVGTCSSMIIGDDISSIIKKAGLDCVVFAVNCHGCMGDNTAGAIAALKASQKAGMLSEEECERQIGLMKAATRTERSVGMASKGYLSPTRGPTKLSICRRIIDVLSSGGSVACVMLAKKELAFRFSDMFLALDEARAKYGGTVVNIANLDVNLGLPRIRGYAQAIVSELNDAGVTIHHIIGGLDEYAVSGSKAEDAVKESSPDLIIVMGIPHCYPGLSTEDILITDQPRELANYIASGFTSAVGEISSHSMVMGAKRIIRLETGDTLRELIG